MSQATQTQAPAGAGTADGHLNGRSGASPPDLLYSEDETALREAVRALLDDQASWRDVLARTESGQAYDTGLWKTLAEQVGCAGLLIPEEQGGAGASYREAATVAEELGASAAPVPFLGSAVVATTALLAAGDAELLEQVASGEVTAALAVPFATAPRSRFTATVRIQGSAPGDADGTYRLSGTVPGVADALPADVLVVPADGVPAALYVVAADAAGVTRTPVTSLDMTRQLCDVTLDNAVARRIATGDAASQARSAALAAGAGILASEQLGIAQHCLDMTVAYVKERRQFARVVGSFQAIKHRLADLFVTVVQARAAARYAADCLAKGDADAPVAVALAKSMCSDVALKAAQEAVQLHGGIGFTWEHPAHLFLKRAKADSIAFGTADVHRGSLAALADLPPAGAEGS